MNIQEHAQYNKIESLFSPHDLKDIVNIETVIDGEKTILTLSNQQAIISCDFKVFYKNKWHPFTNTSIAFHWAICRLLEGCHNDILEELQHHIDTAKALKKEYDQHQASFNNLK